MSKFGEYVKSSYDELVHKVSWPTFKELQSSAIVVAMDIVFAVHSWSWQGLLGYFYNLTG